MDAYDRHKKLVNDYLQFYGGSRSDFRRDESERLAKRYWDKLFKEYCLVDLSRYKEHKFGMRWRLEKEVIAGKGQFTCGNVHCAAGTDDKLRSWEVNFSYQERGERRNALVKLRLCPDCSDKLNYKHKRRDVTRQVKRLSAAESETETSEQAPDSGEAPCKKSRTEVDEQSTESNNSDTVWRNSNNQTQSNPAAAPKTQDEEFDDYFSDMLL